jgi:hypothetical protein
MKIGITLNDTVRVFEDTVAEAYEMFLKSVENTSDFVINDLTDTPLDADESGFVINEVYEERKREKLNLSVDKDPFFITHRYEFMDEEEFNDFMYDSFAFEIFARTKTTYPEAMDDLNSLYNELVSDGHSVTVVSQERSVSKSATLLFLAQNKFQGNNIKFLYNYSKIWELFDVIITSNPLILETKPENKICFKILTDINENLNSTQEFEDLDDVRRFYRKNKNKRK